MGDEAYMPHDGAVEDHSMPDRTASRSDRLVHPPDVRTAQSRSKERFPVAPAAIQGLTTP